MRERARYARKNKENAELFQVKRGMLVLVKLPKVARRALDLGSKGPMIILKRLNGKTVEVLDLMTRMRKNVAIANLVPWNLELE